MKMKKILMKYREIARYVNPEIKVQKDSEWLSYVDLKTIGIPQMVTEQGEQEFLDSVKKQLPQDKKDLINIIPDFMWSFLHELGHIEKEKYYFDTPQRTIANFLCKHGLECIGNIIYFNLKEERKATEWAVKYALKNTQVVIKFSYELDKTYRRYYKTLGLQEIEG